MTRWLLAFGVLIPLYGAQATQDPEAVYNRVCVACHAGQLPNAPKRGDQAAWQPRLAKGMGTLVQHVTRVSRRCRRVVCAWTAVLRITRPSLNWWWVNPVD